MAQLACPKKFPDRVILELGGWNTSFEAGLRRFSCSFPFPESTFDNRVAVEDLEYQCCGKLLWAFVVIHVMR